MSQYPIGRAELVSSTSLATPLGTFFNLQNRRVLGKKRGVRAEGRGEREERGKRRETCKLPGNASDFSLSDGVRLPPDS